MEESLSRLAKADPETYQRAFDWLKNVAWGIIESDPEKYFLEPGPYPLRDAILQAVLQDAIAARGYMFSVSHIWPKEALPAYRWKARIFVDPDNIIETRADSPAATLLAAYLSAIEEQA